MNNNELLSKLLDKFRIILEISERMSIGTEYEELIKITCAETKELVDQVVPADTNMQQVKTVVTQKQKSNPKLQKILDFMIRCGNKGLTTSEIAKRFKMSHSEAYLQLKELRQKQLVTTTGRNASTKYWLS